MTKDNQGEPTSSTKNQEQLVRIQGGASERQKWQKTNRTEKTQQNPRRDEKNQGEPCRTRKSLGAYKKILERAESDRSLELTETQGEFSLALFRYN